MERRERIAATDEISHDTTFLFTVREQASDEEKEAILVRSDGDITGWLNYYQHFTHVRLDNGSGGELRENEIVCTSHGAMFDVDTGLCTFGPCDGAYLEDISVTVENGSVYLTDPDYEFVAIGPEETDSDLSSSPTIGV